MVSKYLINSWKLLKEPKFVSRTYYIVYALFMLNGVVMFISAFDPIRLHSESTLSFFIAALLSGGGGVAMFSLHRGEWFRERAGIYFIFGGLIGESLAIISESWPIEDKVYYFVYAVIILAMINVRRHKIKDLTLDPNVGS